MTRGHKTLVFLHSVSWVVASSAMAGASEYQREGKAVMSELQAVIRFDTIL